MLNVHRIPTPLSASAYSRIGDPPMVAGPRPSIMHSGRADPNLPVDCLRLTGRSDPCPFHLCFPERPAPGVPCSPGSPVVPRATAIAMDDRSNAVASFPPEQRAIRDKCFHTAGTFIEFRREEIDQSISHRFEQRVAQ